jgi:hypothetical protein
MTVVSRRLFLAGVGSAWLLAACGGDDGTTQPADDGDYALLTQFPPTITAATVPARLPIGIAEPLDGTVVRDTPATVPLTILDDADAVVAELTVPLRSDGVPLPYYEVRHTFAAPGTYFLRFDLGERSASGAISVVAPGDVTIPKPGDQMPPLDTPTVADGRGVEPICTREPACPLHDVTLAEALTEGRPVAFLVGTPAYCQTGVCGPILDNLLAEHERMGDRIRFLHAEVYTEPYTGQDTPITEAVAAYTQIYEPAIFLADATGLVVDRIDVTVDRTELVESLERLLAR